MTHEEQLRRSWDAIAEAWTEAVRGGGIPSRNLGTNQAILSAISKRKPPALLDVGCGEGWLGHTLGDAVESYLGIDGCETLIERGQEPTGATSLRFQALRYEHLSEDPSLAAGPWDTIVCNFSLLSEEIVPLLSALRQRLAPEGRLVIQTVHSCFLGDGPYVSGWRSEDFAAMATPFPAAMPWYFRTLGDWINEIRAAALEVVELDEPLHPETQKPLSLLLECAVRPSR